jgi:hypothetical protein
MAVALEQFRAGPRCGCGMAMPPARPARFHRPARRVFLWRLSAFRRDGGDQPDHARGDSGGAARGVPVLGVCNGFQVLTEAGLLPGALMRNAGSASSAAPWADGGKHLRCSPQALPAASNMRIPVAHHDGNYFADAATLDRLEGEGRVAFRYTESVNGSARDIAGCARAPMAGCWA